MTAFCFVLIPLLWSLRVHAIYCTSFGRLPVLLEYEYARRGAAPRLLSFVSSSTVYFNYVSPGYSMKMAVVVHHVKGHL